MMCCYHYYNFSPVFVKELQDPFFLGCRIIVDHRCNHVLIVHYIVL